jgi:hypothetical protein
MALGVPLIVAVDAGGYSAQGDVLVESYAVADLAGLADHHTHAMVDEQVVADDRGRVDFDPGRDAGDLGDPAGKKPPTPPPQRVGQAMEYHGLESGITNDYFYTRAGRRVQRHHGVDIGPDGIQHVSNPSCYYLAAYHPGICYPKAASAMKKHRQQVGIYKLTD